VATNLDGSVVVGSQGYPPSAMIWDSGGAQTVKALIGASPDLSSDWTLEQAAAVSDDGKFILGGARIKLMERLGSCICPEGRGWLATW
jgi:hypothetical protein